VATVAVTAGVWVVVAVDAAEAGIVAVVVDVVGLVDSVQAARANAAKAKQRIGPHRIARLDAGAIEADIDTRDRLLISIIQVRTRQNKPTRGAA
jgi:hypothetical protein